MCLEGSQPAAMQWAIDFSATTQCRHHLSVLQQKGYNCFDMHSHPYYTHPPEAFKFSLHGLMETVVNVTSAKAFHTAVTFSVCRSRSIWYSYFLLSLIKGCGVTQTIPSLMAVISFTATLRNMQHGTHWKGQRKMQKMTLRPFLWKYSGGWFSTMDTKKIFLIPKRENDWFCTQDTTNTHMRSLRERCQSE